MYLQKINKSILLFLVLVSIQYKNWAAECSAEQYFHTGFTYLYNFEFYKADSIARQLKTHFPTDPTTYIFAANCCWWRIVSGEFNEIQKQKFHSELDMALSYLNVKKKEDLTYQDVFNYINVYAYRARIDIMAGNYLKAVKHIDHFINYQKISIGKESLHPAFNLTSGLYNYTLPYTIKNYPFLLPFLPEGNLELGIKQLTKATSLSDDIINTEANYFLMKIYSELQGSQSMAKYHAEILVNTYPDNLLYRYYYFGVLLKQKRIKEAEKQLALIKYYSTNKELSADQKAYFVTMATEELKQALASIK